MVHHYIYVIIFYVDLLTDVFKYSNLQMTQSFVQMFFCFFLKSGLDLAGEGMAAYV